MRTTLESQLQKLQADNAQKLEQMRATVDEKLQSTLNTRLDASFKLVSERLEAVQRGLGEMQQLAVGVGEIGRASCRDRVCQYVSISEVAVSLKKKTKNVRKQPYCKI